MYSKYERPIISASLFYYDTQYDSETARKVLQILDQHTMFPPDKIHADILTNNRYIKADVCAKDIFVKAYSEKDVLGIDMASGDSRKVTDYWRFNWKLTYNKNQRQVIGNKFKPWNIITLQSTYGRLQNEEEFFFIDCVKALIKAVSPFYASIDDIANKLELQNLCNETHFTPDKVQTIYWGNYFGREYTNRYGLEKIMSLPAYECEKIDDGVFFALSDSLHNYGGKEVVQRRKQIKRILQI